MKGPNFSLDLDSKVSTAEDLSKESIDDHIILKSFRVCWWNGGGAIRNRMSINPGLNSLLKTNPDILSTGKQLVLMLEVYFYRDTVFFSIAHILKINKNREEDW